MSRIEWIILILAASIPFLALIIVLPKNLIKKNKEKKGKPKSKKAEPIKEESNPKEESLPQEPKMVEKPKQELKAEYLSADLSTDDFRSYLTERPEFTRPKRIEHDEDFVDKTTPYIPPRPPRRHFGRRKPKNVSEEIQSLSPELKALIIAGVLDRKF